MNNSRPIIKIFLFPYTERSERIFSSNVANFFIFALTRKCYIRQNSFGLRIGKLGNFYKYINRLLLGSKKKKKKKRKKKTFKRTEKLSK